jgi:hypothetical protein
MTQLATQDTNLSVYEKAIKLAKDNTFPLLRGPHSTAVIQPIFPDLGEKVLNCTSIGEQVYECNDESLENFRYPTKETFEYFQQPWFIVLTVLLVVILSGVALVILFKIVQHLRKHENQNFRS